MTLLSKEKAKALLDLLSSAHAEQYVGLDNEMADDCNDWIGSLTEEEVTEIVLSVFRNGI